MNRLIFHVTLDKTSNFIGAEKESNQNVIPDLQRRKSPDPILPCSDGARRHFDDLHFKIGVFFLQPF